MNFEHICPDCFKESFYGGKCRACGYENEERSERCLPLFYLLSERYIVGRVLGIGGFGITYKGYDIYNNMVCAVKEYVPMNISVRLDDRVTIVPIDEKHKGFFMHGQERFIEEAIFLKRLSAVKEIVNITDYFNENNTSYFTMEFLDGVNLKSLYRSEHKKGQKIPFEFSCQIMVQIGRALDKIHTQSKIFHRDISPENIFITTTGDIKLIDFGNAKHCTQEESQNISVVLKPGFAPPEQYSTKGVQGPWTDVYALACTFYLIASGVQIPSAPDRLQGVTYKPLYQLNPQCTMEVSNMIDLALKLNHRERLRSVMPLVEVLEKQLPAEIPTTNVPADTGIIIKAAELPPEVDVPAEGTVFTIDERVRPYIKVIKGDQAGNKWYIPADIELLLGRSQTACNIVLSEYTKISNRHCTISYSSRDKAFFLKDLSTNGTFVGGARLNRNTYYLIPPEAEICLADNICILKIGADIT